MQEYRFKIGMRLPPNLTAEQAEEVVEKLLLEAAETMEREHRRGTRSVEGPVEEAMLAMQLSTVKVL